jgi:hypothetical protein
MAWRLAHELSVSLDHLAGTWEDTAEIGTPEAAAPAQRRLLCCISARSGGYTA